MKDFIHWRRQEERRERIRNRPADWRPPTWDEVCKGISEGLKIAQDGAVYPKTWDYESLYKN